MTYLPFSNLGIHPQARVSIFPVSEKTILADLRHAWATEAEGAVERAEAQLLKTNRQLHAEYQDFMGANPRVHRKYKAEMWCKQELEGPDRSLPFHGEPVVLQQGMLSKKRHRSPEPPVIERTAKEFDFKRPKPVKRPKPEGLRPADPRAR